MRIPCELGPVIAVPDKFWEIWGRSHKVTITILIPGQGAGGYGWFFVKRVAERPCLVDVLAMLEISAESTPSLEACNASILSETNPPPRAPLVDWAMVPEAEPGTVTALAQKMGFVNAPAEDALDVPEMVGNAQAIEPVGVDAVVEALDPQQNHAPLGEAPVAGHGDGFGA